MQCLSTSHCFPSLRGHHQFFIFLFFAFTTKWIPCSVTSMPPLVPDSALITLHSQHIWPHFFISHTAFPLFVMHFQVIYLLCVYINTPRHSALPGSGANPERNTEVVNTLLTHNCTTFSESSEMCILLWHSCCHKDGCSDEFWPSGLKWVCIH